MASGKTSSTSTTRTRASPATKAVDMQNCGLLSLYCNTCNNILSLPKTTRMHLSALHDRPLFCHTDTREIRESVLPAELDVMCSPGGLRWVVAPLF
jgi:hypothetical protein